MKIVSDSPLQKPEGGSHFSPRFPDGDHPPEGGRLAARGVEEQLSAAHPFKHRL